MENKDSRFSDIENNILPVLKELVRKLWIMALVGVVLAGIFLGAVKLFVKPTYRCGFTAYVNNQQVQTSKDSLTSSDLTAAKELVRTYEQILISRTIITASAESIDSNLSYETIRKMISTEIQSETEIIAVYVTDTDPQLAYDLACAMAKTSPTYMAEIIEGSSMKIVDYPIYTDRRFQPSYSRTAVIGFLIGALAVMIIVIIRYFTDDKIKDENELEMRLSIPVLGVIPDINHIGSSASDSYYKYGSSQKHLQSEQS